VRLTSPTKLHPSSFLPLPAKIPIQASTPIPNPHPSRTDHPTPLLEWLGKCI
jgi:hypothetical protein